MFIDCAAVPSRSDSRPDNGAKPATKGGGKAVFLSLLLCCWRSYRPALSLIPLPCSALPCETRGLAEVVLTRASKHRHVKSELSGKLRTTPCTLLSDQQS